MIDLEKSSADKFIIDRQNNTLIVPFNRIKGLGVSVAESIVNERNKKMFISKEDLKERTKINKKQYVEMIRLGVLDKFSDTAQMSILDMFNS
jgi:DNA polymerase-3 subunit alpha (Gram-positive type)